MHPKPLWVHSYLPNVGREGDAYLAFIIHNYDSLPHHTLFAQPCHSPDGVEAALKTFVPATTQVLNLGGFEHGTLNGTAAYPMRHLCELYMLSHGNASCPGEEAPFFSYMGSQFVVSRERLRRNPLALYQLLRDRLASPLDDPLHGDIEAVPDAEKRAHFWAQTRGPSGTNYYSYQLERGWAVLFDCMRLTTDAC